MTGSDASGRALAAELVENRNPRSISGLHVGRGPIDGSPPRSPVPGILQARILEWVAEKTTSHSGNPFTSPNTGRQGEEKVIQEPFIVSGRNICRKIGF